MIILYVVGCIFFVLLQGFFAASEIAFISSSILTLRHRREDDKRARLAYQLLSVPEKFLATSLVGVNISAIISSTLATYYLYSIGVSRSNLWITFLFTPVVVIFAELVPKNIGRYYKEEFTIRVANSFKFFQSLFLPVVSRIEEVSTFLIKAILGKAKLRSFFVTREEIKALIAEAEKEGGLEKGEKEAIEDIFDFGQTKLKDVYVPLKRVIGIDYTDSLDKVKEIARIHRFTRYPVFKGREIIGYINIFDLFYREPYNWHSLIRPITHLGVSQKLYEVFTLLRDKKENMAVVMRGKKSLGIVTLEDLIKEILNSIVK
jgi:putative hemolysin